MPDDSRVEIARVLAFFEATEDNHLLHRLLADVAPRARREVGRLVAGGSEEGIPSPVEIAPGGEPATAHEAKRTVEATTDFALLQTLARAIGRRVEALEVVASASFPAGSRVSVPESVAFPPGGRRVTGEVTATGTSLRVQLDGGKQWQGPPSLARLVEE